MPEASEKHPVLRYLDFSTAHVREITALQKQPWRVWVSALPDGKRVLFQQQDMIASNVMLVENFR